MVKDYEKQSNQIWDYRGNFTTLVLLCVAGRAWDYRNGCAGFCRPRNYSGKCRGLAVRVFWANACAVMGYVFESR